MKRSTTLMAIAALLAPGLAAWAGPVEEVAQISAPRIQQLQDGNIDAYVAAYADNAVFQSALSPFRIEGRDAIRTHLAQVVELYPKRRILSRQPMLRAYGDNLVIQNAYAVLHLTDTDDEVQTVFTRSSVIWARIDGRWRIVDQHTSRLPHGD